MNDRVAIYARVSTDEQAERQTIDNQLHACRQHAEQEGWDVVEEFRDEGVSGSVPLDERPSGTRLLAGAENKAFDRVLVYRLDRLSRDTLGCLLALKRLEALKAPAMSVDEKFDDSPNGRFHMTVMSAVAELEKNLIRQRTMAGRARSVRNGRYLASTPPFGYVREDGVLKPDRQKAKVVRQMFRWAREGLGIKSIAARLEERGVELPNPSKRKSHWGWHFTTIYKILTASRYIGKGTYGGDEKKGVPGISMPCPPLVDEETFYAVQAGLKRHKRDSPRNTTPGRIYLLQHLLYCRHCGSRYTARTVWGKDGERVIYQCRRRTVYGKKAGHEGVKWRWHGKELERAIQRHVLRVMVDRDYLVHDAKVYREEAERRLDEHRDQQEQLRNRLAELEHQEVRAQEGWEKGGVYFDENQFHRRLASIRAQQEEVRAKLVSLVAEPPAELTKTEKVRLLADDLWMRFARTSPRGLPGWTPTKKGWEDEAIAWLGQHDYLEREISDEDQYKGVEFDSAEEAEVAYELATTRVIIPLNEWWRDVITGLVKAIWVEDDGKWLEVEGVIEVPDEDAGIVQVASGKVRLSVPDVTRTR